MQRLNPLDAAFVAYETEGAPLHVAAVLTLAPPTGRKPKAGAVFAAIEQAVAARIHLVPVMRQRILQGPLGVAPPVLVDDPDFLLSNHLTRAALPAPGGQVELERFVGRIMSRPMFLDRPLWEMIVIEGLEGGRSALMARFHHATIDGISGAHLLAEFFDFEETPRVIERAPAWLPAPLPEERTLMADATASWLKQPVVLIDAVTRTIGSVLRAVEHNRALDVGRTRPTSILAAPKTSINGTISAQRIYELVRFDFAEVKGLCRSTSTSVTDVVLAVTAGALRRLFAQRGETVGNDLVAMVPVSTRPQDEMGSLGNQISTMLVNLATTVDDPLERLAAVAASAGAAREQDRVLGSQVVTDLTRLVPPFFANLLTRGAHNAKLFDYVPPVGNVLVSSVPGPDFPLSCAGLQIESIAPVGPIAATIGLNVTAMRYLDELVVGLLACHRLVPDLDQFSHAMVEAFDELVLAASSRADTPTDLG